MSKIVQFKSIQFSKSTQFKCKYSLIVKTFLFRAIHFSISTQFSSIWPIDRTLIRCYHSGPEWTWEQWQWRGTPHSPKLQQYWNLSIRLFSVISRSFVEWESLTPCRETVGVFYSPSWLGKKLFVIRIIIRSSDCLLRIIIIDFKLYNCVQTNELEIATWNHIIISIRLEYLKLYNCVQIICVR